MNRWNIPAWLEREVIARDERCVYCGVNFAHSVERKTKPSWEHIVNDERIINRENIALCCMSCNASKSAKLLHDWFLSNYCKSRNINAKSVASVVSDAIRTPPIWINPNAQPQADKIEDLSDAHKMTGQSV